jgi:flagellar assembly protein FliH
MSVVQRVIKHNEFVRVAGIAPTNHMKTPVSTRSIDNGEKSSDIEKEEMISKEEQERIKAQKAFEEELERVRLEFLQDCETALEEAQSEARGIVEKAKSQANALQETTAAQCVQLSEEAREKGYADGFEDGRKAGFDAGFADGRAECKASVDEVNGILERIPDEKEKIFKDYENRLFDLIFDISNKITAGSLNQKDKSVISKMLKEAAKGFRGSSYIKVSLSKLDLEESVNVDIEDLRQIFGESDNTFVEFEILKDAPKGTLILDNDSEITDASISTQLKMIQNLGQGKFKNKPDDDDN